MIDFNFVLRYNEFMEKKVFTARKNDKLANLLTGEGFSYNNACKMIRNKDVKVDGERVKDNIDVVFGSQITVFYSENSLEKKFETIYEDENIAILNKKAGIEVEGEQGLASQTGYLAVHRLDRNTSGLIVMAKNQIAKEVLLAAFKERNVEKKYLAEVVGKTNFDGKVQKAFLFKDNKTSFSKISDKKLKNSVEIASAFKTIKASPVSSIVECTLITGKTHQLRAHLAFLGHAIIGDGKYGKNEDNKKFKERWQKLHCYHIKFDHLKSPLEYLNGKTFEKTPDWLKIK